MKKIKPRPPWEARKKTALHAIRRAFMEQLLSMGQDRIAEREVRAGRREALLFLKETCDELETWRQGCSKAGTEEEERE